MKVVDMHCDTITELYTRNQNGEHMSILENRLHLDLKKMKAGDYLLQNFALFTHLGREKQPLEYCLKLADAFYQEITAYPEWIGIVRTYQDILENEKAGRMSAMLTVEEGGVCLGDLAILRDLYRLGVRMMTLTWNFPNQLAFPNKLEIMKDGEKQVSLWHPETEYGLTETGIAFVQEMERLGMIIDISHLGDAGIWDVFRYTTKPFVASHSNARTIAGHPRNLTDEMIRALSERGGVAGINYCAAFLKNSQNGVEETVSRVKDIAAHIRHMKQIGGIACVGLGSDFDGIPSLLEMKDASGLPLLADELHREGFTWDEIEAVFSKNVLRVYQERLS